MTQMGKIISAILLALGIVIGLSILVAMFSSGASPNFFTWIGDLLFQSFHLASWYVPSFLIVLAGGLWGKEPTFRRLIHLLLGLIPALCFGLTLRLMLTPVETSPFPAWVLSQFGLQGSVIVAGALTLLSFSLIVLAPLFLFPAPRDNSSAKEKADPSKATKPGSNEQSEHPEAIAVKTFKQGIAGLLESGPQARPRIEYPDLDQFGTANQDQEIGQIAPSRAKSDKRSTELANPAMLAMDSNAPLEVFLGQDGRISDYPPPQNHWSTNVADEDLVAAGLEPETAPASLPDNIRTAEANAPVRTVTDLSAADSAFLADPNPEASSLSDDATLNDADLDDMAQADSSNVAQPISEIPAVATVFPLADTLARRGVEAYLPSADAFANSDNDDSFTSTSGDDYASGELQADEQSVDDYASDETEDSGDYTADTAVAEDEQDVDVSLLPPIPEHVSTSPRTYKVPIAGILDEPENRQYWLIDEATTRSAHVLKTTLEEFGIQAEVTGIRKGPVITMFEILPAPGVKLTRITNLSDNIALRLAAQSVRIVAPIPGKHAVGIEIPNRDRAKVSFAELLAAEGFSDGKFEIPIAIGKDITGDAKVIDLTRTPHLLIAGSTGSGKSVCVNALICSILYRRSPAEVNLILVDPKIVELKFYNDIPHLLTPVITDPKKAFQALQWCLFEMERRYSLLDAMQVRDIKSFNKKIKTRNIATPHMPYLVIVIDEFADLMATSGKELEATLARLAAMSRAVGIHLVLATQRPSTDVITGLIKANIPSRIAFMVASKIDSRIIIDCQGAENLLGKGDMLFTSAWDPFPSRLQGAFLSDEEVERVVTHVKTLGKPDYIDDEIFFDAEDDSSIDAGSDFESGEDPLMKSAIEIVVTAKKASASYLQRRLKIGYNRAARLVEQMEEMGIVGPPNGSKPREILRMFQN